MKPHAMDSGRVLTRRQAIAAAAGPYLAAVAPSALASSPPLVSAARCASYGEAVMPVLRKMFEQLGGIGSLVAGKTVAVKINMESPLRERTGFRPAWYSRWTHPDVIRAAVALFAEAGAKRIRILESSCEDDHPLEENFILGGWDPDKILKAAPNVEMENTAGLGYGKRYHRIEVKGKPYIYPGFDVNHSYVECDVMVSMAKLKEHRILGLALTMENMLGITPVTIYGESAGYEEPALRPYGRRTMFETGYRQPSEPSPKEVDPHSPRDPGYRLPRVIADVLRARPVHLAILDGIETQTASEMVTVEPGLGRKIRLVQPGVLIAGLNPVATDAVGAAVMGFDPLADRPKPPFERADSFLRLAEEAGLGPRDLSKIALRGDPLKDLRFSFREQL